MPMFVRESIRAWEWANIQHYADRLSVLSINQAKVAAVSNDVWVHLEGIKYGAFDGHLTITPGACPDELDWQYIHLTIVKNGATHAYYIADEDGNIQRTDKVVNKDKKLVSAKEHNQNPLLPAEVDNDVELLVTRMCVHKWT